MTITAVCCLQLLIPDYVLSTPAESGGTDEEIYTLGEVVVTGRMGDKEAGVESIGTVHTVTAEEIRISGARNLNEAIDLLPGVNVMVGGDAVPKIDIRGFRPRHNILLLNGIPINSTYDHQFNPSIIPVENIAEIKMTSGASSVLYGQGGLGGVINIITKKGSKGLKGLVGAEIGQGSSYRGKASVSGQKGELNFFASADFDQRDAFPLSHDFEDTPLEGDKFRNNSDKKTGSVFANLGYKPNANLTMGLTVNYLFGEYGIPVVVYEPSQDDPFAPNAKFERMDGYNGCALQLASEYYPADSSFSIRGWLFYNQMDEDHNRYADDTYTSFTANPLIITYTLDGKTTVKGVTLQPGYDFADIGTLTIGLSAEQDTWESTGTAWNQWSESWPPGYLPAAVDDQKEIAVYSAMAEYEHRLLSPAVGVTLGIGFHYQDKDPFIDEADIDNPGKVISSTEKYDQGYSVLAGGYYDFTETLRFKAAFQRNIRFPSIRQLYDVDAGNPELETERVFHYSAGIEKDLPADIRVTINGFHTVAKDFIEKDSRRSEQFENYDKYLFTGAEITSEVKTFDNLFVRTCYSYLQTKDETGSSGRDELQYRPKHRITLESKYRFSWGLVPYISCVYVADQCYYEKGGNPWLPPEKAKLDDYVVVNVKLNYRFGEKFSVYAGADNVFDTNYQQSYGYPLAGRYIYGGGEIRL